jgi:hypothetical protein
MMTAVTTTTKFKLTFCLGCVQCSFSDVDVLLVRGEQMVYRNAVMLHALRDVIWHTGLILPQIDTTRVKMHHMIQDLSLTALSCPLPWIK